VKDMRTNKKTNSNKKPSFKDVMVSYFNHKNKQGTPELNIVPPKKKEVPNITKIISPFQDNIQDQKTPSTIETLPNSSSKKDKDYLSVMNGLDNLKKGVEGLKKSNLITNNYITNNFRTNKNIRNNKTTHNTPNINEKMNGAEERSKKIVYNTIRIPFLSKNNNIPQNITNDNIKKVNIQPIIKQTISNPPPLKSDSTNTKENIESSIVKPPSVITIPDVTKISPAPTIQKHTNPEPTIQKHINPEPTIQKHTKTNITSMKEVYNNTKDVLLNRIIKNNKFTKSFATSVPTKNYNSIENRNHTSTNSSPVTRLTNISNSVLNEVKNIIESGKKIKIPSLAIGGVAETPTIAQIGDAVDPSGRPDPEIVTPMSKVPEMLAKTKTMEKSQTIIDKNSKTSSLNNVAKQTMSENNSLKLNKEESPSKETPPTIINSPTINQGGGNNSAPPVPQNITPKSSSSFSSYAHLPRWRRGMG
jgi:hypothetical protein